MFFRNHAKENCQEAGWGRVMFFFRNPGSKILDVLKLKICVLYRTILCIHHTCCLLAMTVISIKAQHESVR